MSETRGPKLLTGDLNTTMWSHSFTGLLRESGMSDARRGFGLMPSRPVPPPALLRTPIDHCLVGGGVAVEAIKTGGRTGSDHRPLVADVSFKRREEDKA